MNFNQQTFSPFTPEHNFSNFVGRNEELEILKKSLVVDKNKVVAISGNNATGKTSLWRVFLEANKESFNNKVEVVYTYHFNNEFPEIEERIKLVIIEELSFEFGRDLENKIRNYISRYPSKQFILVGAYKDKLDKLQPDKHIHLSSLRSNESAQLLLNFIEKKVSESDLLKIVNLTNGNPFLIRLVAQYLNSNKYNSINQILNLISENIHHKGLILNNKKIIDTSPEFKLITTDISIVNKSILDKIKSRPEDVYNLTPRQFEEMVAELMTKRGYQVDLTKQTRDGGKDLIIANHSDIGDFMYYVECKRYAAHNPIGVNLIRELAGTISADRVTAGLMITSSYFSPDAIQFSGKFKHQIGLVDFIKLKEWINNCS